MAVYGLTGGIGSGKTEVASVLAGAGIPVIQADDIAREQLRPGQAAYDEVVEVFGDGILGPDGEVDRRALASVVFGDSEKLKRLNVMTHPRVMKAVDRRLGVLREMGHPVAVIEAALLVESGAHEGLDGLLVVTAPDPLRLQRVMDRDGVSAEEVKERMASQLPQADKAARADWNIENDAGLPELREAAAGVAVDMVRRGSD